MKIGYARVSTDEQNLDLQLHALKAADCDRIFEDQGVSAVAKRRPGFEDALASLSRGDIFVIWKMDRACRSLRNALDLLEDLEQRGVEFVSLTEAIDTTTPMGKAMYQIRGVFSELERSLIVERTRAGIAAARRRGVQIGRPAKLTEEQIELAAEMVESRSQTIASMARMFGVAPLTLSRALKRHEQEGRGRR
jgi:DNA invertase Pin-like site-specific DNA recombinase